MEYVSIIQAIVWLLVFTSGAGISDSGPMITAISVVKRRVRRSISPIESCFGSTVTPPFPPPYGRSITAHFHDIHIESAFTSSMFTS